MSEWKLKVKYHVKGTTHEGGYCSDPGEKNTVDYTRTVYKPAKKDWVNKYCDNEGFITYLGLNELSYNSMECSGSGYCGTGVKWNALSGKLVKVDNIKKQFLNEYNDSE
jgi:hypothetical protein